MVRFCLVFVLMGMVMPMAFSSPSPSALAPAINSFGFSALKTVAGSGSANVCLSPVSLHLALDMARCGAAGKTAAQMSDALATPKIADATLRGEASDLMGSLNAADPKVTVTVANSLWIDSGYPLLPSYVDACKSSFGAEVSNLDLKSPASIARINKWVSDKTNAKIDHILENSDTGEASILVNALYFKGAWQTPFSKNATTDKPFHLAGGKPDVTAPQMDRTGFYNYCETAEAQVVRLPFGMGRYGFIVALPKTTDGLAAMVSALDGTKWNAWMKSLTQQYGEVALPRFKMTYDITMNKPLEKMGMPIAFSRDADFSNMIAPPAKLRIDFVKHDTYLSVDEDGAEAAAATAIGMTAMGMRREPDIAFHMIVDHPFFCAIVDSTTGAVLFEGAVYNPK